MALSPSFDGGGAAYGALLALQGCLWRWSRLFGGGIRTLWSARGVFVPWIHRLRPYLNDLMRSNRPCRTLSELNKRSYVPDLVVALLQGHGVARYPTRSCCEDTCVVSWSPLVVMDDQGTRRVPPLELLNRSDVWHVMLNSMSSA